VNRAVVGRLLDEAELVERAKRGDASAYRALMEMHEQIAFRTAYAVTGTRTPRRSRRTPLAASSLQLASVLGAMAA
jgi:hypothetical protein